MIAALALEAALAVHLRGSGMVRPGPVGLAMPEASGAPMAVTYRIDLDARLWCSDACGATEPVDTVFEGMIVLRDSHTLGGSSLVMINPAESTFSDVRIVGSTATLTSGSCRVEPFAGFPDPTI